MLRIKKILCFIFILAVFMGTCFPAGAVTPGSLYGRENEEENAAIRDLLEQRAGYPFDSLGVIVYKNKRGDASFPIETDPLVKSKNELSAWSDDKFEYFFLNLNTSTEEELNSFIAKYENDNYIYRIEKNGFAYIPEAGCALVIDLCITDLETGDPLPVKTDFSVKDFSEKYVKNVYISNKTGVGFSKYEKELLGSMENTSHKQALLSGIPTQLVLHLNDHSYQNAALFALELIDFENSELFTEEQKAMFRQRLSNIEVFYYDFVSTDDKLDELVKNRVFKLWGGQADDLYDELIKAKIIDPKGENYVPVVNNGRFSISYIFPDDLSDAGLNALAEKLSGISSIIDFEMYGYVDFLHVRYKDSLAAALLNESAVRPGDIDGDGKITSADARSALRAAVKLDYLFQTKHSAADVSGDGEVTAADARDILRAAVGLDNAENFRFTVKSGDTLLLGPYYRNDGGYEWNISPEQKTDGFSIKQQYVDVCPPHLDGCENPGFFLVTFDTPGSYSFKLTFKRAWENSSLEQYSVSVFVSE